MEKADDRFWIAVSHRLAAWLALDRGRLDEAVDLLEKAIRDYALAGAQLEEAEAHAELAPLLARGSARRKIPAIDNQESP